MFYSFEFGTICGDGDGFCAGGEVGEGVKGCHGGGAGVRFAGGDVDF